MVALEVRCFCQFTIGRQLLGLLEQTCKSWKRDKLYSRRLGLSISTDGEYAITVLLEHSEYDLYSVNLPIHLRPGYVATVSTSSR